jgi:hypothetical protein
MNVSLHPSPALCSGVRRHQSEPHRQGPRCPNPADLRWINQPILSHQESQGREADRHYHWAEHAPPTNTVIK